MAQTQTLQLQYLYTLSFHLMKVLSLLPFAERPCGLKHWPFFKKLEKLEKKAQNYQRGESNPRILSERQVF